MGRDDKTVIGTPTMTQPALQVENIAYAYGPHQALQPLSFTLPAGHILGVLGPNGAGKSTLMGMLTRLLKPQQGCIHAFSHSLAKQSQQALRHIGVVFQQSTLDLDLTVEQNLHYHGALHGMSPRVRRIEIDKQLARFALQEKRKTTVRQLNGGHRRRVELARALLHNPSLLLLDEPTAGLDRQARATLSSHIRELVKAQQLAVLWTTHLLDELQPEDDLLVLHQGQCKAKGKLSKLLMQHQSDDVGALFDQLTRAP